MSPNSTPFDNPSIPNASRSFQSRQFQKKIPGLLKIPGIFENAEYFPFPLPNFDHAVLRIQHMRNICLTLSYDGTDYVGWQVQPNGVSVQSKVESAVEKLTGESIRITGASRTDSGVHALGQVANFRTTSNIATEKFLPGLQNFLPDDIVVHSAKEVREDFHATYSACWKCYRYFILNRRVSNPLLRNYVWRISQVLDLEAMQRASAYLIGKHDFRCFESQFPNKSTSVRTVMKATCTRMKEWRGWNREPFGETTTGFAEHPDGDYLSFEIVADGFLYNMVRAIVGTLHQVGRGRFDAEDMQKIIESGDRSRAGETAPAKGLHLIYVNYEKEVKCPT